MTPTVRVSSPISDDNPSGFVVINEADFDASAHELFGAEPAAKPLSIADLRDALTARGIEFDPAAKKADLQALLDAQ